MESSSYKYYPRLDHLRFLAAFLVLSWHITVFSKLPFNLTPDFWLFSFLQEGHTGVALFMSLSGFIFWSLCRSSIIDYQKYIYNRVLRIAPLFIFWIFIYFYTTDIDPVELIASIFGLLNKNIIPGNAWTIIVEFQFYLIFPFLLIFCRALGVRYLIYLIALALVIRLVIWYTMGSVQYLAYSTIFGRIDQFCLGMFFCEISHRNSHFFSKPITFVLVLFSWVVVFRYFDSVGGFFDSTASFPMPNSTSGIWIIWPLAEGFFWGLVISCYFNLRLEVPYALDKLIAWMGTLSYSLYLNQNFSIQIVSKVYREVGFELLNTAQIILFGAIVFLVLLGFSFLTYNIIERPFLSLRANYLSKQTFKVD